MVDRIQIVVRSTQIIWENLRMSDDADDAFLGFSAAPIPTAQPKQKSTPKSTTKKPSQRKQVSQSAQVYGEELFQTAYKPLKSIVICFWPYTKNHIRISKDDYKGRFAIKYNIHDHSQGMLYLYHYDPPLNFEPPEDSTYEFLKSTEVELTEENLVNVYGPYDDPAKIKLQLIDILRKENRKEMKEKLEELRAAEKIARAEKERLENEAEQLTEQLADAGILANMAGSNLGETTAPSNEEKEDKEISSEAGTQEEDNSSKIVKDRSGATLKLTPIVW